MVSRWFRMEICLSGVSAYFSKSQAILLYPYSFCHWVTGERRSYLEFPNHVIVRTNRRTSHLDACFSDRCLVLKHRTGISSKPSRLVCRGFRDGSVVHAKGLACSSFTSHRFHEIGILMENTCHTLMSILICPNQHSAWGQFLRLHNQFAVVKCSCYLSFSHCLVFRCSFYPHSSYVVNYPFSMFFYCKSMHFYHEPMIFHRNP